MISKGDQVLIKAGPNKGHVVVVKGLEPLKSGDVDVAGCRLDDEGTELVVYLDDVEEMPIKTFVIRYLMLTTLSGPGHEVVKTGYCRMQTHEAKMVLVSRLREEGFQHKDAGHDWWVMPGAIMSVEETDHLGYSISRKNIRRPS